MTDRPRALARLAGALYMLVIVAGMFAEFFVRDRMIVTGDAARTAANILAQPGLWRASAVADFVGGGGYIAVTVCLYFLTRPAGPRLALAAAFFSLAGCAATLAATVLPGVALDVLGAPAFLSGFDPARLQGLAYLLIRLHARAYSAGIVVFGVYCAMLGVLAWRSGYLPRWLGGLLFVGGLGWLLDSLTLFGAPSLNAALNPWIMIPPGLGETALALWLLIFAVDERRWEKRAIA